MLRDILRRHPNFACPEETQFFRWSEPFGTQGYHNTVLNNPVLKRHREIDGIEQEEFSRILKSQKSRAGLYKRYMELYIQRKKPSATRWFDKSPQNVYGAPLVATTIPGSKFIHIVRDPVQVVSSLRIGKVMKVESLVGACNYWNEAASIMLVMKRAFPKRVFELHYEEFVDRPMEHLASIFDFLGEPFDPEIFNGVATRKVTHDDTQVLNAEEIAMVKRLCRAGRVHYGYAEARTAQQSEENDL